MLKELIKFLAWQRPAGMEYEEKQTKIINSCGKNYKSVQSS
jgi:hypothetical protein